LRRDLADMRVAQNPPLTPSLQNAVKTWEAKINDMRERINEIKSAVIDGCKKAVSAFHEKGEAALNNIASFFHIKDSLIEIQKGIDACVCADDQAVAKIEAFSGQYHEAGKAVKNMGRALQGKEAVTDAKPTGKLAKAIEAPYKAERSVLMGLWKATAAAAGKLENLERSAAKKPSLAARLEANKERVEREKRERPVPERTAKARGAEI
jgi:hypothetical protein